MQVISARRANQTRDLVTGKEILIFRDGYLYEFSRTGDHGSVLQFETSAMTLEPQENLLLRYRVKAAPSGSLARSTDGEEISEFQWRLSTPVATIMLAMLIGAVTFSGSAIAFGTLAGHITGNPVTNNFLRFLNAVLFLFILGSGIYMVVQEPSITLFLIFTAASLVLGILGRGGLDV